MAKLVIVNKNNSKVRNLLLQLNWKVDTVITLAHGHAIIAMGTCPGCGKKWSREHRGCVMGLFPNQQEQCNHRECR